MKQGKGRQQLRWEDCVKTGVRKAEKVLGEAWLSGDVERNKSQGGAAVHEPAPPFTKGATRKSLHRIITPIRVRGRTYTAPLFPYVFEEELTPHHYSHTCSRKSLHRTITPIRVRGRAYTAPLFPYVFEEELTPHYYSHTCSRKSLHRIIIPIRVRGRAYTALLFPYVFEEELTPHHYSHTCSRKSLHRIIIPIRVRGRTYTVSLFPSIHVRGRSVLTKKKTLDRYISSNLIKLAVA